MLLTIPISFYLVFNYFYHSHSIRLAFICSYLILCFQIFIITEVLSLFNYINSITVFFSHLFFIIIYIYLNPKFKILKLKKMNLGWKEFLMISSISIISFITLITALFSPPNNWDSLTYHMARVSHWIQNSSVDFFDTNNERQNIFSPFSEFFILHLQILSNSDVFANLMQWISSIICIVTISLISKELGLKKNIQILSSFILITLPMVILQSSTTQNDLILSAFILLFYFFQISYVRSPSNFNLTFSGLSLGLGILTKGSSYIFLFSIGITFFIYSILTTFKYSRMKAFTRAAITVFIGFLINIPHYLRCYMEYGNILGTKNETVNDILNEVYSLFTIYTNFIKHIGYQLGTNFDLANWYIYRTVQIMLGGNGTPNLSDPRTSFLGWVYRPPKFLISEDHSGNIIHTLLFLFIFFISIFFIKKIRKLHLTTFVILILATGLYCLLIKWQPWTGKTLPLFIITIPYVIVAINCIYKYEKIKIFSPLLIIILLLSSIPYLFYIEDRPLLPLNEKSILIKNRESGYFVHKPLEYNQFKSIVSQIEISDEFLLMNEYISLNIGFDSFEYPFWVLLKNKYGKRLPQIQHFKIDQFKALAKKNVLPKYIIVETKSHNNLISIEKAYEKIVSEKDFSLFERRNTASFLE